MGNTTSNVNSHRPTSASPLGRDRIHSPSPTPGNPHSSLRTKKKSLELPDLASLSLTNTRGRQNSTPPKSASIPIPIAPAPPSVIPGEAGRQRPHPALPSTTDVLLAEPSTHIPFPPHSSRYKNQSKSRSDAQHIQELYNQSHVVPPPPPSPNSVKNFIHETVNSSLPLGLIKSVAEFDMSGITTIDEVPTPDLVQCRIIWRGGGKIVFLARAGDEDWKGRQLMERESSTSSVYHATVALPPGTHHIRFLVDDQWRVADYLPTAVDDQGSLANYVDVPVSYSPPNPSAAVPRAPASSTPSPPKYQPQPPQTRKLQPGQSFWSATSSTDDESHDHPADQHHHHQGPSHPQTRHGHGHWTTVLPQELIEAAREEEAYLNASAAETSTHTRGGTTYVNGFVPAPNIPPAPGLPRHLDKLILNSRIAPPTPSGSGSARASVVGAPTGSGAGGKKHGPGVGATGGGNSVGRKQGRDRERKERERERDKQERRKRIGGIPPAPPPSEVGDTTVDVAATSPDMTPETPTPTGDSSIPTSPVISTPPTSPVPSNTPPVVSGATGHGYGPGVPVLNLPVGASAATHPASATYSHGPPNTPTPTLSIPNPNPTSASAPSPTPPSTRPLSVGLGLDHNEPALADDASVLPVPSHVVLHHLCTSAIRNGVLAVGNTTRYRKKYLTTIYYKPT